MATTTPRTAPRPVTMGSSRALECGQHEDRSFETLAQDSQERHGHEAQARASTSAWAASASSERLRFRACPRIQTIMYVTPATATSARIPSMISRCSERQRQADQEEARQQSPTQMATANRMPSHTYRSADARRVEPGTPR